ncbi:universal stress protein [Virgibacillus sp. YIM 98842]|jgi:nucleotide-binding universal stress UspA family protein|uniref:universal stress protein n=1 Tax=Virgibacillus sp. YIM 98842 TaxID=2663533 RepID=UPI0013DB693C|nr:universal stress protein [Virgibacillus sp. YIM 98842]
MKRRILVAYDGSEQSKEALQEAKLQAAGVPETEVHILAVVTKAGPSTNHGVALSIQKSIAEKLEPEVEEIKQEFQADNIAVETRVYIDEKQRNAGKTVCEYAKVNDIDLIIAGSRGLGSMRQILLGSVSNHIVQYSHCPILIIK